MIGGFYKFKLGQNPPYHPGAGYRWVVKREPPAFRLFVKTQVFKQCRIKISNASEQEIQRLLEIASRDLTTAGSIVSIDPDWAYDISLNTVLQFSRAFILRMGFHHRRSAQHTTVNQFINETIGKEHEDFTALFDQMWHKRNRAIYETAKFVGDKETLEAMSLTRDLATRLIALINQDPTGAISTFVRPPTSVYPIRWDIGIKNLCATYSVMQITRLND